MKRVALGIDLGGTNIKTGMVAEDGTILRAVTLPTESHKGPEALLARLIAIAADSAGFADREGYSLEAAGIGTAGQVSRSAGIVAGATAALPGWAGMPLGKRIQAETGIRVIVDNDVNMIALGEAWHGAGRSHNDFICVALGTGIGGCWITDKRVYAGRDGFAGEFGHTIVQMGGRECSCGGRGCWEAYASVTGLIRLSQELKPDDGQLHDPVSLFRHARQGDASALTIVEKYCDYVAAGLIGLIHSFNPSAIVLGGAIVAGQGSFLLNRLQSRLAAGVMPVFQSPEPVKLLAAELGEQAGVIGAASAAFASLPKGELAE